MSAAIVVQRAVPARGIPAAVSLRQWARAALGRSSGELTLRIVGQREGRALNRRWRGKDRPTNVLAFRYDAPQVTGDVVICAPVVAREAREQQKTLRAHWAHLVVHGVLHLLGHDHQQPADAAKMESRERRILAGLKFPDPYRDDERTA